MTDANDVAFARHVPEVMVTLGPQNARITPESSYVHARRYRLKDRLKDTMTQAEYN